ncbi:MAG: hypothetical protein AAF557_24005 [Pseudomonadota bacterium]
MSPAPAVASDQSTYRIVGPAPYFSATIMEGPNPRGASVAAPQGKAVILIDPKVMVDLPYLEPFVLAHECAHHVLNHTSPQGLLREGHLFKQKELDADCWAAHTLADRGEGTIAEGQIALFLEQTTPSPGPRYPAWRTRAKRMQGCMDGTIPLPGPRE